jgi:hypothetical protein
VLEWVKSTYLLFTGPNLKDHLIFVKKGKNTDTKITAKMQDQTY